LCLGELLKFNPPLFLECEALLDAGQLGQLVEVRRASLTQSQVVNNLPRYAD
jgi:hypothetical protein